jgi:hypothetical protein
MSAIDSAPTLASHLPYPLACRILHFTPRSGMKRHSSPWAELNFAISGIMEIGIRGVTYLSPPQYAIWIPPHVEHCCQNEGEVHYACIDIPAAACAGLPTEPCTLEISPVMRAILGDFEQRGISYPDTPEDRRMAQIVIDQVRQARAYASYLPSTSDPLLAPILSALQHSPCATASSAWACRSMNGACGCAWSAPWACWTRAGRSNLWRASLVTARRRPSSPCSSGLQVNRPTTRAGAARAAHPRPDPGKPRHPSA